MMPVIEKISGNNGGDSIDIEHQLSSYFLITKEALN
jgi:hypothetical protein